MRRELFLPTPEAEARLLILIAAFSGPSKALEGRTKLAKLDFFLRYPAYFARAMAIRRPAQSTKALVADAAAEGGDIETRMVRFKYGPWDPSYFAVLGRLVGKGLIEVIRTNRGLGYRTTQLGSELATRLGSETVWAPITKRAAALRQAFDITGNGLKEFVYRHFPEVVSAPQEAEL